MPLYTYECPCGQQQNLFRSVATRHDRADCDCGKAMKKIIAMGYSHSDVDIETDDIDGTKRRITSSHELKKLMRQNDVVEKFGRKWI